MTDIASTVVAVPQAVNSTVVNVPQVVNSTNVGTGGGGGGTSLKGNSVNAPFTANVSNRYFVDVTTEAIAMLLPDATQAFNGEIEIYIVGTGHDATFNTADGQTVLGRASGALVISTPSDGVRINLVSDGANWRGSISYQ